jgi:hypothetical protein
MTEPIVDALRILARDIESGDGVANLCIADAADMLELFFGQMQAHRSQMSGTVHWRLRGSGWPMTHCTGNSREAAIRAVIADMTGWQIKSQDGVDTA